MYIKRALFAAVIVWTIGVSGYTASYLFDFMENPELQAKIVLTLAVIPSALLGAFIYDKRGHQTHVLRLDTLLFITAMILDTPNRKDKVDVFAEPFRVV